MSDLSTAETALIVTAYQSALASFLESLTDQVLRGGMPLEEWMGRIGARLESDRALGIDAVVSDYERRIAEAGG